MSSDGDRRADPGRQPEEVPQEHGRVGAHAEEGPVTEGDEAEAPHQGPRIADERPQEDLDDDVPDVLLRHAEGQRGHQRDREEDDGPGRRAGPSGSPREDAAGTDEDQHDEDDEGDDVAHLRGDEHAAEGDHLRHDEGGEEGADHVPEPAEHADHEGQRAERAAEVRMDGVLE